MREMVAGGHRTFACAPDASEETKHTLLDWGIYYENVELDRTGVSPFRDMRSLSKLARLFKKLKPDVVFGYTIKPVIYGSLAARAVGVPNIFSLISGLGYTFSGSSAKARAMGVLTRRLYTLALNYNSKVFFQNPDNMEMFAQAGIIKKNGKSVLVNGSGVDLDMYAPALLPKNLSFLLIARLIKQKGIHEYVEVARRIKAAHPEVKFRLAGFIDKNPAAIKERDLNSWCDAGIIEYLGHLKDVRPAIADSSVYVLPSYYPEGTPRSVLEAMAMGRPIVTTNAPGCRETVIQGQNGFLVPLKDVDALTKALEYFIKNRDHINRMGKASRCIAKEKYDVRKVNKVMLKTMDLV
jgi:glycosyltransferase involved in cell wall biosynthesis